MALFGLLVTLNPDLQAERQEFITPAVRMLLKHGVALARIAGRAAGHCKALFASLPGRQSGAKNSTASESEKSDGKRSAKKTS